MDYRFWPTLSVAVVATVVGLFAPAGWARRARPVADRPWLAAALLVVLNLAVNGFTTWHHGPPQPYVNDEYGYLLIADTFRHGRLTNPTPADPDAFASPHVLLHPTYTAKYPPGQATWLLAGELLGHPVVGVWLSSAAAVAALYWMLLAFAPPPWAVLGGVVAAVHPTLADWGYCYWGGDAAVLGGALAVGGWGRLGGREAPDVRPGLLFAVGLVVLAFTRPYEGFVVSLPLLALLATSRHLRSPRVVIPPLLVLLAGGLALLRYDAAVTGHPSELPIAAYAAGRDVAPKLWLLPERSPPPPYPNDTLDWMHAKFEPAEYHLWHTLPGIARQTVDRAAAVAMTVGRPGVLLLPLAFAVGARRLRWVWITAATAALGLWLETFYLPHYAAPAAAAVAVLTVAGWQRLHGWSPRLSRALVVGTLAGSAWSVYHTGLLTTDIGQTAVTQLLGDRLVTGRHLLFVRYTAGHNPHDELAYDGADPAAQRLLWVRARDAAADRAVVRDYPGRRAWLLTVGAHDITPRPYAP